jgi:hypothetical protein
MEGAGLPAECCRDYILPCAVSAKPCPPAVPSLPSENARRLQGMPAENARSHPVAVKKPEIQRFLRPRKTEGHSRVGQPVGLRTLNPSMEVRILPREIPPRRQQILRY